MLNSNLLKGKIIEKGLTLAQFSELSKIKRTALYRKLSGKVEFTRAEIEKIADVLHLSPLLIKDIFLRSKFPKRNKIVAQ